MTWLWLGGGVDGDQGEEGEVDKDESASAGDMAAGAVATAADLLHRRIIRLTVPVKLAHQMDVKCAARSSHPHCGKSAYRTRNRAQQRTLAHLQGCSIVLVVDLVRGRHH